ncbi:MAG: hypothetical protein FJZ01_24350, partial [Candidatus Sericytochromatia bacterium]|nr:hypothetical protein [Candidatus Tanganyikabacteria bacterium]
PAKPVARAPVAKPAKPVAKAPVARPEAKAPAARPAVRNPFEYTGGTGAAQAPGAAGTPPGRNPFSFGGEGAPAAKSLPGQAQRRTGGMPVVPAYPDDSAAARRKGAPPVAVDHAGAKPVAKGKRGKHMASSPGPTPRKD